MAAYKSQPGCICEPRVTNLPKLLIRHRALGEDRALFARLPLAGRLPYRLLLNFDARTVYSAFDYVLASARKPTQEGVPNGAV